MHWYQQGHNPRSTYIKKKKENFKKSSSDCSIHKTSSNNEVESENEFFWHQNQSIFRSQIRTKLLNSEQLYCATSQH